MTANIDSDSASFPPMAATSNHRTTYDAEVGDAGTCRFGETNNNGKYYGCERIEVVHRPDVHGPWGQTQCCIHEIRGFFEFIHVPGSFVA